MRTDRITNQMNRVQKRLYSVDEAAVYLGRSVWGLREMVWAGKLPIIKDGRRILLDINDLDKWIDNNRTVLN